MQTVINNKVKHFVCPECVANGFASDPRATHPDAWVQEQLCYSHDLYQALHDPASKHPAKNLSRRTH